MFLIELNFIYIASVPVEIVWRHFTQTQGLTPELAPKLEFRAPFIWVEPLFDRGKGGEEVIRQKEGKSRHIHDDCKYILHGL